VFKLSLWPVTLRTLCFCLQSVVPPTLHIRESFLSGNGHLARQRPISADIWHFITKKKKELKNVNLDTRRGWVTSVTIQPLYFRHLIQKGLQGLHSRLEWCGEKHSLPLSEIEAGIVSCPDRILYQLIYNILKLCVNIRFSIIQ